MGRKITIKQINKRVSLEEKLTKEWLKTNKPKKLPDAYLDMPYKMKSKGMEL